MSVRVCAVCGREFDGMAMHIFERGTLRRLAQLACLDHGNVRAARDGETWTYTTDH